MYRVIAISEIKKAYKGENYLIYILWTFLMDILGKKRGQRLSKVQRWTLNIRSFYFFRILTTINTITNEKNKNDNKSDDQTNIDNLQLLQILKNIILYQN